MFAWGGGGKMAKCLVEHCASPEKDAQRGGGGYLIFFRPKKKAKTIGGQLPPPPPLPPPDAAPVLTSLAGIFKRGPALSQVYL